MSLKRIVITGGPGTGKTSIINELIQRNHTCLEEVSRQVTLEAQKKGIDQLFLTEPLLFSDLLLKGRIEQYDSVKSSTRGAFFFDRGIPDIVAYMDYLGTEYPERFVNSCKEYIYDCVFILSPWQEIYVSDNERYENFDQALVIHDHLVKSYTNYGYKLHDVPFGSVNSRTEFILDLAASL